MRTLDERELERLKKKYREGCDTCRDMGVTLTLNSQELELSRCQCVQSFHHAVRCAQANIPERYLGFSFDKLSEEFKRENRKALQLVSTYLEKLDEMLQDGQGLFFQATHGLAKSSLLGLILETAIRAGHTVFYARLSRLLKVKFDVIRGDYDAKKLLDFILTDVELLALEEIEKVALPLATHDVPDTLARELFDEILGDIYDSGVALLVTSNVMREDLTHLSPAIQDRLRELTEIVFVGRSHRAR